MASLKQFIHLTNNTVDKKSQKHYRPAAKSYLK